MLTTRTAPRREHNSGGGTRAAELAESRSGHSAAQRRSCFHISPLYSAFRNRVRLALPLPQTVLLPVHDIGFYTKLLNSTARGYVGLWCGEKSIAVENFAHHDAPPYKIEWGNRQVRLLQPPRGNSDPILYYSRGKNLVHSVTTLLGGKMHLAECNPATFGTLWVGQAATVHITSTSGHNSGFLSCCFHLN